MKITPVVLCCLMAASAAVCAAASDRPAVQPAPTAAVVADEAPARRPAETVRRAPRGPSRPRLAWLRRRRPGK
jgi:hypothetical protein